MVTLDAEEMKIFMKVCLESDKKNILNKSITYPDFCRIICIIGLLKLFAQRFTYLNNSLIIGNDIPGRPMQKKR